MSLRLFGRCGLGHLEVHVLRALIDVSYIELAKYDIRALIASQAIVRIKFFEFSISLHRVTSIRQSLLNYDDQAIAIM